MFGKKPKEIMPYSPPSVKNNVKITPDPDTGLTVDLLNEALNTQKITNAEFLTLSLLKQILLTLGKIQTDTRAIAISNEKINISTQFVGKFVSNKFSWV